MFKQPSQQPARRRRASLALEMLEVRCVPAVFNVNSLADILNPGPGVVTLRSAIQQANTNGDATNTINLTVPGLYRIALKGANEDQNATGAFDILAKLGGGDLTIQNTSGARVVVDGNHMDRVFDINPNPNPATPKFTVTLQGFTIQNGLAQAADGPGGSGGGIRDQGNASLTLINLLITNNTATADGGGVAMENATGSTPWTLTVNRSTISGNHAGDAGGGIDTDGKGVVNINAGTLITGNSAVNQGGGIWLDAIQGGVNAVLVTSGGSGYTSAPKVLFSDPGNGGTTATGFATIKNGQVVSITITNSGNGYAAVPKVEFVGGNPTTNAAATATIVTFGSATLNVSGATISNNYAHGVGGGIGNGGNGAVTITASILSGNQSLMNGGGYGDENAAGTLIVSNSLFVANLAGGNGGGVFENGPSATISRSTFRDNLGGKGGPLFADTGTTLQLTSDLFVENTGYLMGGGVEADGPTTTIGNSEFRDNSAGRNGGGALFVAGGVLNVSNSTFANNTTGGSGGGLEIRTTGVGSSLINTTITGNSALNANAVLGGNNGGGIDVPAGFTGTLVLVNDTINGNYASNGGGVYWGGDSLFFVRGTIIAGNFATTGPDANNLAGTFGGGFGGNLIGISGTGSGNTGLDVASTQTGTLANPLDPLLGPLQNNGGPTVGTASDSIVLETEALVPGSPALGKGTLTGIPAVDERGAPRVVNGQIDVGAFQTQPLAASRLVLVSSLNPTGVGLPVTFTATVSGHAAVSNTPGGTVTFRVDGVLRGTADVINGVGRFTLSSLTAGSHTIRATYHGDVNFGTSTAMLTEVVRRLENVSSEVRVERHAAIQLAGGKVLKTVVLTNRSQTAIAGPLYLVLDGLPVGVQLLGASGSTSTHVRPGDPYLKLSIGRLLPGQSVTVNLLFANPLHRALNFNTFVFAGLGVL